MYRRDITLPTKVHIVKAMIFQVVMYGCESWTIKKAEHWRIDAVELWCLRRLLRVPWTARISGPSVQKEINLEYSLEGLMLKLNLQYLATWCKELTDWKRPWCWEKLKAGGEEGGRGWDSITDSINLNLSKLGESVEDGGAWCGAVHGVAKSQIRPSDRTIHEWWWKWAWNFQRPFGETELLGFWDSGKQGQKHHFKSVPGSVVQRKEHNPWPWMVLDSHPASPLTRLNVLG